MKASLFLPIILILFLFLTPLISFGARTNLSIFDGINIWQNASCGGSTITATEGPKGPCGFCDAIVVAANVMDYMFDLVFYILFPVFFAWGGIQFMLSAGNPGKVKQAKQILVSTVIGFIIAAAAWLIMGLFFHLLSSVSSGLNPTPENVTPSINPWNKIDCGTN